MEYYIVRCVKKYSAHAQAGRLRLSNALGDDSHPHFNEKAGG